MSGKCQHREIALPMLRKAKTPHINALLVISITLPDLTTCVDKVLILRYTRVEKWTFHIVWILSDAC